MNKVPNKEWANSIQYGDAMSRDEYWWRQVGEFGVMHVTFDLPTEAWVNIGVVQSDVEEQKVMDDLLMMWAYMTTDLDYEPQARRFPSPPGWRWPKAQRMTPLAELVEVTGCPTYWPIVGWMGDVYQWRASPVNESENWRGFGEFKFWPFEKGYDVNGILVLGLEGMEVVPHTEWEWVFDDPPRF